MSEAIQSQAASATTPSFEAALVLNAAVFGAEILAFTLLRRQFKTIYEPRTFLVPENKRVQPLPEKLLEWPVAVFHSDPEQIRAQNGLDAYLFVRFLRMMVKILLPIWFISWAVLLPVTSVKTSSPGHSGLDLFTFGNVGPNDSDRYSAHIILVWLFTGYIFYILRQELSHFITARQHHLVDPVHSATARANTVLVTGVPQKYLSIPAITHLFSHVPGGVRKVWLNRDLKDLPAVYDRRLSACNKLESAENTLLMTAAKLYRKKHGAVPKEKDTKDAASRTSADLDVERRGSELEDADRLIPRNKRPTHRLPIGPLPFGLPLIGKKVDSIDWARAEIIETTKILEEERDVLETEVRDARDQQHAHPKSNAAELTSTDKRYPPLSSAFVLFHQQIGAHIAAQSLTHNEPFRMAAKYTEVAPADVVWGNLGLNPYEASVRTAISYGLTAGLIIVWAIPVAFIGIVSNIAALCSTYSWLAWLCTIPSAVRGIIQGILPPVLLAILFMLLPIVLRLMARFEGIPTRTGVELSLMTRFFIFQVIHGFLIVTISSGIIAALPGLVSNPGSIPTLLAQKLPSASTFFLTYIILQGLSGTAGGFLTIVPLALYYVKMFILGSTPRSIYNIRYNLRDVAWGTLFPSITLLVVITLGYSIISPIINGLACTTFFLFYMLYKYLFIWQLDMPPAGDTGGLFFPKAIQHVFVGLYVQQICLCALFFLAEDSNKKASAIPEGALMIVLILITAFYNHLLNSSYDPLLTALPLSLADRSYGMPTPEAGAVVEDVGDVDVDGNPTAQSETGKSRPSEGDEVGVDQPRLSEGDGDGNDIVRPRQSEGDDVLLAEGSSAHAEISPPPDSHTHIRAPADAVNPADRRGPTDFAHPAVREAQRPIWLAADALGLAHVEERTMAAEGVEASTVHAAMDTQGHVEVDGPPPGEED